MIMIMNTAKPRRSYERTQPRHKTKTKVSGGARLTTPETLERTGGKETGARCSHYIVEGGPYELAFDKLAASGWHLNLQSAHIAGTKVGRGKQKFSCPSCGQNVWGSLAMSVICASCGVLLQPQGGAQ
jgi:hypothetical protein